MSQACVLYRQEQILWIHTKMGYSYALQYPHSTYSNSWNPTIASWVANHRGVLPTCHELTTPFSRPTWWPDSPNFHELEKHIKDQIKMAKKAAVAAKRTSTKVKKPSAIRKTRHSRQTGDRSKTEPMAVMAMPRAEPSHEGGTCKRRVKLMVKARLTMRASW
jgi:hypothetical protein